MRIITELTTPEKKFNIIKEFIDLLCHIEDKNVELYEEDVNHYYLEIILTAPPRLCTNVKKED